MGHSLGTWAKSPEFKNIKNNVEKYNCIVKLANPPQKNLYFISN